MTTAARNPLVPVDECMNSICQRNGVRDGALLKRGTPTPAHVAVQSTPSSQHCEALSSYEEQFGYGVLPECRIEIVKQSRYRIPDVLLCSPAPYREPRRWNRYRSP